MALVQIVVALALLQFVILIALVARARDRFGVKPPSVTGHETFERYLRVQVNTLEILVVFVPSLWLAAQHWSPGMVSGIGVVYLLGRVLYVRAYIADPSRRLTGFVLSLGSAAVLLLLGLGGAILDCLK